MQICWELWHQQVGSLKYLRMRKLQFLNNIDNLLTDFLMEKISRFHFFNFLIWYEVQTCTGNTPWQMKLIGNVINVIINFVWNWFLVCKLQISNVNIIIKWSIVLFCLALLT